MVKHTSDISVATQLSPAIVWRTEQALTEYLVACDEMERQAHAIARGTANEQVWLVEHAPLYSAGTSAKPEDLLTPERFPVYSSSRGGQYTYHGPGQRIAYVMIHVGQRFGDVRAFVYTLEQWLINTLETFDVQGERRDGRVGIWVSRPDKGPNAEDKIGAIGLRLRKWVSFHGISLNVAPNLEHFSGIVPCGVRKHGVTSLDDLGKHVSMMEVDRALRYNFERLFGLTTTTNVQLTRSDL
jgi:lipoyl(octanoyl) transferase